MKTTKTYLSLAMVMLAGIVMLGSCSKPKIQEVDIVNEVNIDERMNDENVLKIVATLTVKNEKDREEIEKVLYAVVDGTHTEEGNISYELHQDINNPLMYVFIEVWESQQAIDIHNETPHFKAFVKAVDGKVDLSVITMRKIY